MRHILFLVIMLCAPLVAQFIPPQGGGSGVPVISALSTPGAPIVTPTCTGTCATSWTYYSAAANSVGYVASASTTATNAATLDSGHHNLIAPGACQTGQTAWDIYRLDPSYPAVFWIARLACGSTLTDNGLTHTSQILPAGNTTAGASIANLRVPGALTLGNNFAGGSSQSQSTPVLNVQSILALANDTGLTYPSPTNAYIGTELGVGNAGADSAGLVSIINDAKASTQNYNDINGIEGVANLQGASTAAAVIGGNFQALAGGGASTMTSTLDGIDAESTLYPGMVTPPSQLIGGFFDAYTYQGGVGVYGLQGTGYIDVGPGNSTTQDSGLAFYLTVYSGTEPYGTGILVYPSTAEGGDITFTAGIEVGGGAGGSGTTNLVGLQIDDQSGTSSAINKNLWSKGVGAQNTIEGVTGLGLIEGTGSAPSISGCGASIASTSTNVAGQVTSGATGTCTFALTFASSQTYATAPVCYANNLTHPGATNAIYQTLGTASGVTFSGTTVSSDAISYACLGH